jgi:hypothetical protein
LTLWWYHSVNLSRYAIAAYAIFVYAIFGYATVICLMLRHQLQWEVSRATLPNHPPLCQCLVSRDSCFVCVSYNETLMKRKHRKLMVTEKGNIIKLEQTILHQQKLIIMITNIQINRNAKQIQHHLASRGKKLKKSESSHTTLIISCLLY